MKKNKRLLPILLIVLVCACILTNVSFGDIAGMPNDMYVNYQEVEQANVGRRFGRLVNLEFTHRDVNTDDSKESCGEIIFKLFGVIPIKKVSVKLLPEEDVYVGGNVIGLSIDTNGAMVVSNSSVNALSGDIVKNEFIENGDVIQRLNDVEITSVADLTQALKQAEGEYASLTIFRNGKVHYVELPLIKDDGNYKLGIWVRDDVSGVGTLTFVLADSGKYGALGHAIANGDDKNIIPITNGKIYECNLVNIEKGKRNKPGELQCVFIEKNSKGSIEKNTNVGIFGKLEDGGSIIDINKSAKLGGRLSVKPGLAKLISCVSGIQEEYDIEIIKVHSQKASSDKSFVFRVKDERLLRLTGGIVQGMSGSPIMQDDKIVGAVTHVFISDATKGYGVYTDWMLENLQ
ncbi:MAG: SpoIVB peptidase [Clostridia bacterium]|nr:SpoIVB peptidase [Clostridia bacterium]